MQVKESIREKQKQIIQILHFLVCHVVDIIIEVTV